MSARIKRLLAWAITAFKLRQAPLHRKVAYDAKISGGVTIGDYTYIGGRSEVRAVLSEIRIGRYCSIGRDVKIFSSGQAHRFDGLATYPFFMIDSTVDRAHYNVLLEATVIGNDVWIGSNAVIQAGVSVGDGAVIGAGSVVTKDVKAFSVVAGVPARPIGSRFEPVIAAEVQNSCWWDLDYDVLKRKYPDLVRSNPPLDGIENWTHVQ